ncbi:efflux transporter outer membrane subunit [Acinetobacter larvae]|uniref:Membrane channel protein n=1 Tax=Acinetobacter larvae TaxID=1789224 RepID=A0A1B2M098_9GAMM|nr:efflux transporter outer membrane subunit [Acinetobacter larvae]AOA58463.1 membrane channel protein [Acinetobacter larvae]
MKYSVIQLSIVLSGSMLLSACQSSLELKPADYVVPSIDSAQRYKYADLNWVSSADVVTEGDWWQLYQDPVLSQLMQQLNQDNLSLQQAQARYRSAAALLDAERARRSARIDVTGDAKRSGVKHQGADNQFSAGIQASWVPDLWGRVAKAIEGQQANLIAAAADLAAIRLNQQLLAADAYWNIRTLDLRLAVLDQTAKSYQRSVTILNNQYQAGFIARADVIQAETQAKQVAIQQTELQRERSLQENVLAVLLGQAVVDFQLNRSAYQFKLPQIPQQIPSRILSQRPDVIRAERQLAALHAELGLAQTAWLPDVNIGVNAALNSTTFSHLLQSPNYLWSVGLSTVANIFDAGKRQADIAQAEANYQEKLAAYKQSILTGWQEVEDALLRSSSLAQQAQQQQQLLDLAIENEGVVTRRYQAGLVSYLEVVTAQNLRLNNEQQSLQLQQQQMHNTVQLLAALGTGWTQ